MATTAARDRAGLQELLGRIEQTRPILERNGPQTEARRIAQENIDALAEAGASRVTAPRHFGGYKMAAREQLEVSAAVAESCGSTGWVVALINICNWMAGALLERARQDIFAANPDVKVAGVLNPTAEVRVDGRFMVSGS